MNKKDKIIVAVLMCLVVLFGWILLQDYKYQTKIEALDAKIEQFDHNFNEVALTFNRILNSLEQLEESN